MMLVLVSTEYLVLPHCLGREFSRLTDVLQCDSSFIINGFSPTEVLQSGEVKDIWTLIFRHGIIFLITLLLLQSGFNVSRLLLPFLSGFAADCT